MESQYVMIFYRMPFLTLHATKDLLPISECPHPDPHHMGESDQDRLSKPVARLVLMNNSHINCVILNNNA